MRFFLSTKKYRTRRIIATIIATTGLIGAILANPSSYEYFIDNNTEAKDINEGQNNDNDALLATVVLEKLEVKGRAPKTGYSRDEFYSGWPKIDGCNLRQLILKRELGDSAKIDNDNCTVLSGEFDEPYTGSHMIFYQKSDISSGLQIDHVVALSDAWQKGAQYMSKEVRYEIATDPLNLLAVDSKTNQGKSDGDSATWLPPNKSFRCQYVARQVSVKYKYGLWVTEAEHNAIAKVLETCPTEPTIGIKLKE